MKKLHDIVIPLVTPLTAEDRIDVDSLKNLTDYLIGKGVNCLYPCGTTGEMVYLTDEERMLITQTVVGAAKGRVPVFAHVGAANTDATIRLARHAAACGADGIGVVTPWYFRLSDCALEAFYREVSASVPEDFPVYLYAIRQNAGNDITAALAERIAQMCPNVVGIKYSSPDMTRMQELMAVRDGSLDLLAGADHLYAAVTVAGGKGVVSGNAMILPEHYIAIRDAMAEGDWQTAFRVQRRTNVLNAILCEKNNIGFYKFVLKALGVIATANMRRPMERVSDEDGATRLEALQKAEYQKTPL